MSESPRKPTMRGAVAGSLLVGTMLLCAGVGLGVGALVGATAPLAMLGLLAGVVAGILLVRARFRDL
jgi:hypothetical protein